MINFTKPELFQKVEIVVMHNSVFISGYINSTSDIQGVPMKLKSFITLSFIYRYVWC